jgi:hypothetical protein
MSQYRHEGRRIHDDLLIWLPLAQAEELIRYTSTPEDVLPVSSLATGLPSGTYLEITRLGRSMLTEHDHAQQNGGVQ